MIKLFVEFCKSWPPIARTLTLGRYGVDAAQLPTITYIYPNGHGITDRVMDSLQGTRLFPTLTKAQIVQSDIVMQDDCDNCGVWVVEIIRYLINQGTLPAEDFDVHKVSDEHRQILERLRARPQ